ncbi:MAG: hypothetical protein CYPHOPRED_005637 [Cyphobasidiales sp. Tagirdzhanova-0007]|nr:MAG: hypothetical protein CYPHOPRED_005637 [Cyphobasidiales sp. Tagirdzhanova-0007]
MRFTAALAFPLLLASSAVAQSCTCSADDEGSVSSLPATSPVKKVPKVTPTEQNLNQGVAQAVQGLTSGNVIPASVAGPIQSAIQSAISKSKKKSLAVVSAAGSTKTLTISASPAVETKTVTDEEGTVTGTLYVTRTITALPPGGTILSNETLVALNDIQNSINEALASVNLSETGLDAAAQAELQTCLKSVLENGGLPAGYSCISQSGSTSAGLKSTFNNVLEQFLGILPAKVIDDLQDAVMPMLTGLLPSETTLLNNINSAVKSVVDSLSGNSVTAVEMMQSCYSLAIKQNSNTSYLQCYMSSGGPFATLETAMNSVVQQFVGYLPGNIISDVQNLTASTLKAGAYEDVSSIGTNLTQQLNAALSSVTSALTGNSVTLMEELQACANELLVNGNATAATKCVANDPAQTARTMVNSVAQQYAGYIPSAFFSDLVSIVSNLTTTGNYSKAQIITALDQAFNNANMGPAYVGCFEQVQTCLLNEITATGNYSSVCPGPVSGCELIGSQNSTSLANSTHSTHASVLSTATKVSAAAQLTAVIDATSSSDLSLSKSTASLVASAKTSTIVHSTSIVSTKTNTTSVDETSPATTLSKRSTSLKRSHAKLRLLYDTHYQRL